MPTTYDFTAKNKWREWVKRGVENSGMGMSPKFRRALLLDPQLLETEMLETLGYKANNIVVVERDPEAFGVLQEKNEWRSKNGKEKVNLEHADLKEYLADIVLSGKKQRFDHISLDMLCQFSHEYGLLLQLISAGRILADDSIFISNLQARREKEDVLCDYEWMWFISKAWDSIKKLLHSKEVNPDSKDCFEKISVEFSKRIDEYNGFDRASLRDLKELRRHFRLFTETRIIDQFSNEFYSRMLSSLGKYVVQFGGQEDWARVLCDSVKDRAGLYRMLGAIERFWASYQRANMDYISNLHTSADPMDSMDRFGKFCWGLQLLTYHHNGSCLPTKMSLYEYVSASNTLMLTAFYRFDYKRFQIHPDEAKAVQPEVNSYFAEIMGIPGHLGSRRISGSKIQISRKSKKQVRMAMKRPNVDQLWEKGIEIYIEPIVEVAAEAQVKTTEVTAQMPSHESIKKQLGITLKEEVYSIFKAHPDWDVRTLRESYQTDFTDAQLRAFKAWVTMRKETCDKPKEKVKNITGNEKQRKSILNDLRDGDQDEVIAARYKVSVGSVRAIKAHKTMGSYAEEETFVFDGFRFYGGNDVTDNVMELVRKYGSTEAIPEDVLERRKIRRE